MKKIAIVLFFCFLPAVSFAAGDDLLPTPDQTAKLSPDPSRTAAEENKPVERIPPTKAEPVKEDTQTPGSNATVMEPLPLVGPQLANQEQKARPQLTSQDEKALSLAEEWKTESTTPFMANAGKITYLHNTSVPTVITSPFQVVDVELESGENINEITVGDSARWMIEAGMAGNTPHLFIKAVDVGLESSAVITTDRRVYHLRLLSQKTGHTPYVGFVYPQDLQAKKSAADALAAKQRTWATGKDAEGHSVDLSKIDSHYIVSGHAAWKPVRVFNDGAHTYIEFPESVRTEELPILLAHKDAGNIVVNYRVLRNPSNTTMMVDGTFKAFSLVVGVGEKQELVEIKRDGVNETRGERS